MSRLDTARMLRFALAIGLALASSGCGFLANLTGACDTRDCRWRSKYYGGVYMDTKFWRALDDDKMMPAQRMAGYTITAIDFPITALLDTLAIPFIAIAPEDDPIATRRLRGRSERK